MHIDDRRGRHAAMSALDGPSLSGPIARLVPLGLEHVDDLAAAAQEDRSTFAYTRVPAGRAECASYVAEALAAAEGGREVPFAVVDNRSGTVVGTTRFLDLEVFEWPPPWPPGSSSGLAPSAAQPPTVAEIGSTWYARSAQGSGINLDCKRLMLGYAFETWGVIRVTLKTDARNLRSIAAIEKIGAIFEGIRRAHVPATDGTVRDSAYFSLLSGEWPSRRARLDAMIGELTGRAARPRSSDSG
jgi:RimJ/RimL family protein N-acetyltransferase